MITKRASVAAAATLLLTTFATTAIAIPVRYSFSTATAAPGTGPFAAALSGLGVSGSFVYDRDTPAGSVTGPPFAGGVFYDGVISDLVGTIGSWSFSDPSGQGVVANDKFVRPAPPPQAPPPPPGFFDPTDFLQLQAETPNIPGQVMNLNGFSLLGTALVNVRFIWLETGPMFPSPPGIPGPAVVPDFLGDDGLPELPGSAVPGRIALDFGTVGAPGSGIVFFEGLTVTPVAVPEPAGFWLLATGLAGLALRKRCAARRLSP